MNIYCCECKKEIEARLTNGAEIYPLREDLYSLPFWVCDKCKNYVGCHYKTKNSTNPLGVIPNDKIRNIRKKIHAILDPIWKSNKMTRKQVYAVVSSLIGYEYHTANIRSIDEGNKILSCVTHIF